ncbi:uncharacterized protein N7500_002975 [Penicillium coprophilum]|uniref:uncharacterized protein n=1 Tax=Penicillium coprophilum TaxID=36646 RepID=UPI0023925F89|nr:uncharacterized protein N7500_002975 [Penicillium coprophilum]KAJ5170192.1 hypothetical protein N7500_002975 [Penicillium coprophilum]
MDLEIFVIIYKTIRYLFMFDAGRSRLPTNKNTIDAITFIHSHGIIRTDISPQSFLVAEGSSIKLCGFIGSVNGFMRAYVEEKDRYRLVPWSPWTSKRNFWLEDT